MPNQRAFDAKLKLTGDLKHKLLLQLNVNDTKHAELTASILNFFDLINS